MMTRTERECTVKLLVSLVIIVLIAALMIFNQGCTDQARTKMWGGTTTIDLPCGTKFVNATWKDADLWYITRPRNPEEVPQTYKFTESSAFGMMQGEVVFIEH